MEMIEDLGYIQKNGCKKKDHYAIYLCPDCGRQFQTRVYSVKTGRTKSCGCTKMQKMKDASTKHNMYYHWLYSTYYGMLQRCYYQKNRAYNRYGGRGISVCDEWKDSFQAFCDWSFNNGCKKGLQIDRINNDGNYEPSNCRWTTCSINAQRRITTRVTTSGYRGVYLNGNKWSASITWNRKQYYLGNYFVPELAAQAYNRFIIQNNTEHPLNIIK